MPRTFISEFGLAAHGPSVRCPAWPAFQFRPPGGIRSGCVPWMVRRRRSAISINTLALHWRGMAELLRRHLIVARVAQVARVAVLVRSPKGQRYGVVDDSGEANDPLGSAPFAQAIGALEPALPLGNTGSPPKAVSRQRCGRGGGGAPCGSDGGTLGITLPPRPADVNGARTSMAMMTIQNSISHAPQHEGDVRYPRYALSSVRSVRCCGWVRASQRMRRVPQQLCVRGGQRLTGEASHLRVNGRATRTRT